MYWWEWIITVAGSVLFVAFIIRTTALLVMAEIMKMFGN